MSANMTIARKLLSGVQASKPASQAITLRLDDLKAALGPAHTGVKNLLALRTEFLRQQNEDQVARPRVQRADIGGDANCPLTADVQLGSSEYVSLPRGPLIACLQAEVEDKTAAKSEVGTGKSEPT